jgi:hypothetical protein
LVIIYTVLQHIVIPEKPERDKSKQANYQISKNQRGIVEKERKILVFF